MYKLLTCAYCRAKAKVFPGWQWKSAWQLLVRPQVVLRLHFNFPSRSTWRYSRFYEVSSYQFIIIYKPNFQKWLQNFEVAENSKFNIDRPLTSMASKTALPYISKLASSQLHLFQRLMGGMNCRYRDRTKTKCPKQWGVSRMCIQLNCFSCHTFYLVLVPWTS